MTLYYAYVDNIGYIGIYTSRKEAIDAVRQTIESSASADPYGYVLQGDDIVAEIGSQNEE